MNENEFRMPTEFNLDLERIEAATIDPVVKRSIDTAKKYNELLAEEAVSDEEASDIIVELDQSLRGVIGTRPEMYGVVSLAELDGSVSKYTIRETDSMIFNGFTMVKEPVSVGGEVICEQQKVKFHLIMEIPEGERDAYQGATIRPAEADLDAISIEFNTVSPERAEAWLTCFYPEFINEVDSRIFNADGSEADAVLALKGLAIPFIEKKDGQKAKQCLDVYLHKMLELDTTIAYSCGVNGIIFTHSDGDEYDQETIESDSYLAIVNQLTAVRIYRSEDSADEYMLCLDALLVNPDRRVGNTNILLPLDSLESIMSIREAYYTA